MNRNQLLIKIKNLVQSEDATYQPIAKFIYKNSTTIKKINIERLAKYTHSSPATVTRFCQSIGLSGFKELTSTLSQENNCLSEQVKNNQFLADGLLLKEQVNEIISETTYLIEEDKLNEFVNNLIDYPEKILFVGYGESYTFLRMFASRLLRLGIVVQFYSQAEDLQVAARLVDDKTFVLALSLSGTTKDVLNIVNLCKERKAKIYSITKYEMNDLKKISDVNFSVSYDSANSNLLISKLPRYGVFFLLDLIFEKLVSTNPEIYLPILQKTRKNK